MLINMFSPCQYARILKIIDFLHSKPKLINISKYSSRPRNNTPINNEILTSKCIIIIRTINNHRDILN